MSSTVAGSFLEIRTSRQQPHRILDLYQGMWEGAPLGADECVLSADEKTSIQARIRLHPSLSAKPGKPRRVEHEYDRGGALAYIGAWDVSREKVFGLCEPKSTIAAFDRLVEQMMSQEPYCSAQLVFWIVNNGSSHRGKTSFARLQQTWPNLVVVHLPVHASWLNPKRFYFYIVQRKVLMPDDFSSLQAVADRLEQFQKHYEQVAKPFEWKFTRKDLSRMMKKLSGEPVEPAAIPA